MASLLFYLVKLKADNVNSIPKNTTASGKPCEWNEPPQRDVQPQNLTNIQFRKLKFGKDTSFPVAASAVMGFDPRNGSTQQRRSDVREKLLDQFEEARKEGASASGGLYF